MNNFDAMLRREQKKLDIEISRGKKFKRQHLPLVFQLQDNLWARKKR